ncbi:hypothetical protein [Sphingobacterium paucimobilis]|uniref:AbiEi antitoxin C-terminal domain-containing protein n=1 Tax=Sphingobacterium paucimobilis HER1398 TaxID=1346330 RepID=U2HXZ5_9SPHI|nr:hypothetical protein [Sphingobacterium paucimobilis]ERJ60437.1 hypothetical protein M472_16920 [Sphingobacterium paucimobilis HER1398]
MNRVAELKQQLKPGKVYRRENLTRYSNAVDRHLAQLVDDGTLEKVASGLYYFPKRSVFGAVPPEDEVLVRSFLKDDHFLLTSPNSYNALRVGTTQLYNKRVVYNHKRHGEVDLNGKKFFFHKTPYFPKKATLEFLLVDLVNHLDTLAEDREMVLNNALAKGKTMDYNKLKYAVRKYGHSKTKKLLQPVLQQMNPKQYAN